jgi:hypothetical protein
MNTEDQNLSPLLKAVLQQTIQLRTNVAERSTDYGRAARRSAIWNNVFGYTGAIAALGTTFMSKLPSTDPILHGLATVSDVTFVLGIVTAAVAAFATQGLTAKKQAKYTDNAVRLDRYKMELNRLEVEIPVTDDKRIKEIQKRLIEIENNVPSSASVPLLLNN